MPLAELIRETIAPDTWRENGGIGFIRVFDTSLIIAQTEEIHGQILVLLDQLRERHGPMQLVGIRAHWVLLEADGLKAILGERERQVLPEVDLGALEELDAVQYRGQTTCFNGQQVHMASGRERTIVTGLQPIVAPGAVGYDVSTERIHIGAVLQIRPQLSSDRSAAILDMQSVVSEWKEDLAAIEIDPEAPSIGRVDLPTQQLATTVRVPVGRPVLIGGMSREAFEPQLYLIIEVNLSQ